MNKPPPFNLKTNSSLKMKIKAFKIYFLLKKIILQKELKTIIIILKNIQNKKI